MTEYYPARARRVALGLSVSQVAAKAEVSEGFIRLLETEQRHPSQQVYERIEDVYGDTLVPAVGRYGRQTPQAVVTNEILGEVLEQLRALRKAVEGFTADCKERRQ